METIILFLRRILCSLFFRIQNTEISSTTFSIKVVWRPHQTPKNLSDRLVLHLETFCASRKFLCVTLEIVLESFRMLCNVSKWSRKFPYGLGHYQKKMNKKKQYMCLCTFCTHGSGAFNKYVAKIHALCLENFCTSKSAIQKFWTF